MDNIRLKNSRLTVEIAAPGTAYAGSRFDWNGFITQVTLAGNGVSHTFCVPESYTPGDGTGGIGLCNEFGIEKPIGYTDAQPGDLFPKLGIGLLKRIDAADYNFFRPHEVVQRFPIQVETTADRVRYVVEPLECRGYAARLQKTISIRENWLEISYQLENVGRQPIETHEYAHNFIGIDRQAIGPDYRLRLPYPIQLEKLAGSFRRMAPPVLRALLPGFLLDKLLARFLTRGMNVLRVVGSDITFRSPPKAPFYCRPLGFSRTDGPQWEIRHLPSGVGLREYGDFAPARLAVWGVSHVVSAEVFVDIRLQPGETQNWSRRYEFFSGAF